MAWTDERTGNEVIPLAQCVHRLAEDAEWTDEELRAELLGTNVVG